MPPTDKGVYSVAERRMFSKTIIDSDLFLDMSLSAQALYFHLSMRADDEGFINNPKKIIRMINASEDDFKILIAKQFLLPFDSGVVVIKHWKIHNYIRGDRAHETFNKNEKEQLGIKDNVYYMENNSNYCLTSDSQLVDKCHTEVRLGKVSIGEVSIGERESTPKRTRTQKNTYGEYQKVKLTDAEFEKLQKEYTNYQELITFLDEYIEMKNYKAQNHYLAIKKWVVDAVNERKAKKKSTESKSENIFYDIGKEEGLW